MIKGKYVHTNLVAKDWKRLSEFYQSVFGCVPVPPERNLSGVWLEQLTGLAGAEIHGMHLRLPGYGDDGPTIEIFQYQPEDDKQNKSINRYGFAHLAFLVEDVADARNQVLAAGGSAIGELVTLDVTGKGKIEVIYVADPEGNAIELQRWCN